MIGHQAAGSLIQDQWSDVSKPPHRLLNRFDLMPLRIALGRFNADSGM